MSNPNVSSGDIGDPYTNWDTAFNHPEQTARIAGPLGDLLLGPGYPETDHSSAIVRAYTPESDPFEGLDELTEGTTPLGMITWPPRKA